MPDDTVSPASPQAAGSAGVVAAPDPSGSSQRASRIPNPSPSTSTSPNGSVGVSIVAQHVAEESFVFRTANASAAPEPQSCGTAPAEAVARPILEAPHDLFEHHLQGGVIHHQMVKQ